MSTIAAISTAPAVGGIGIIRISGENAFSVGDSVFSSVKNKKLSQMKGYTAAYGYIHKDDEIIDECVALVFRAPNSYTGENVVELSCHGGIFILRKVLNLCFKNGAVPAEAGEFTKRAFLNGKMDLTSAEAVAAVISAQGDASAKAAVNAKNGALYKKIKEITDEMLKISAQMAAWIDYPDDDIAALDYDELKHFYSSVKSELEKLISGFDAGQAVTAGVDTVICGRTNAGKSTIMNLLCREEKSIVTDVEGTTRDVVETTVRVGNAVLRLSDTAGLRDSDDRVEKIGIELTRKKIASAGLILAVFDCSKPLNSEDFDLLETIKLRPHVLVINKSDLSSAFDIEELRKYSGNIVVISAKNGENTAGLENMIEKVLGTDCFNPYAPMLATERQKTQCVKALECIDEALDAIACGLTLDAVNVSSDGAVEALLELTGERATEKITDEVFRNFCVGK